MQDAHDAIRMQNGLLGSTRKSLKKEYLSPPLCIQDM
jgi:hypothetical protein